MNGKAILPILILILLSIALHAPSAQVELSLDLEINEPEDIIFNNLKDIATDSNNNIYILDSKEKAVYKFSEEGKFQKRIGRQGQGPGEFEKPCSIYIDSKDVIYVLDEINRRVEIFDSDSNYTKSIKILEFPIGNHRSINVDNSGNLYISGYYHILNTVLAKFSSTGELIRKFDLPIVEYTKLKFNEHGQRMVNQYLTGGSLCFDEDKRIFFSYTWPYLIKILTTEGNELSQVNGKSDFNWTPFIFKTDAVNGTLWGGGTQSLKIFLLNRKYLVNSIYAEDWEGNPERKIIMKDLYKNPEKFFKVNGEFAVLDFYTIEGEFIESIKIDEKIYFLCSDKKGRILGVKKNKEDFSSLVRYKVEINSN